MVFTRWSVATIVIAIVVVTGLSASNATTTPAAGATDSPEVANATKGGGDGFQIVVGDSSEENSSAAVDQKTTIGSTNVTTSIPASPKGQNATGTPSARRLNSGASGRNNTQLLSVISARRSLLRNSPPIHRGAHNYVIQQTMCERNCTKNFTVRGTASCMKRCASPSPVRRREFSQETGTKGNPENDNNISDTNALSTDELLITNESSASHQLYTDMDDSIKNKSKLFNSNLLERNKPKKNATLTKDSYSSLKSAHYFIDNRHKRVSSPPKSAKLLIASTEKNKSFEDSELVDPPLYGQKLSTSEGKSTITTERIRAIQNARQQHFNARNLVVSHRRGMMNFKSSVSPSSVTSRNGFAEDSVIEESRPALISINTTSLEYSSPPPRRNHGILLELPPSTIPLDVTVEEKNKTETNDSVIVEAINADQPKNPELIYTTVNDFDYTSMTSTTDREEIVIQTDTTTEPTIVNKTEASTDPYPTVPNISLLFPNISTAASLLPPNETDVVISVEQTNVEKPTTSTTPVPSTSTRRTSTTTTTTTPSTTTTIATTTQSSTTTTEPSTTTTTPTTTTTTTTPEPRTTRKRIEVAKTVKVMDFEGFSSTQPPAPKPTYSSPTFRPKIRPILTTTTTTTKEPQTDPPTTTLTATMSSIVFNSTNESTLFPSIFNLSSIFSKFPSTKSPPGADFVGDANSTAATVLMPPSRTIVELDSVLLRHNNDVTIELQRMNMATYVLAGLGMFPIVIIILYVIKTIIYNKHQQLKSNTTTPANPEQYDNQKISPVVKIDSKGEYLEILKDMEFNRSNLRFKSILGEGNFGQVWKAEADDLTGHLGATRIVAIKTERVENGTTGGLKTEAEIMYKLGSHPNVVTLLGTCIEEEPHLLIMEFAMRGRLLSLLRAARSAIHSMGVTVNTVRSSTLPLSPRRLSGFAHDIARGMEYIASKNIVHRDLAARNILLDHNGVCKICDFGMSIDLDKSQQTLPHTRKADLHRSHHHSFDTGTLWDKGPLKMCHERKSEICRSDSCAGTKARPALPIRWMAPEALQYHVFTIETDVWAFGIVLWEIATLGCTPYPNLSGREVVRSVPSGIRPEIPPTARPELYKLMAKTWHKDPRQRPTFSEARSELAHALRQWEMEQENSSEYLDVSGFSEDLENGMVYFNRRISEFECEI